MHKTKTSFIIKVTVPFFANGPKDKVSIDKQIRRWVIDTLKNEAAFIPFYEKINGETVESATGKASYKII